VIVLCAVATLRENLLQLKQKKEGDPLRSSLPDVRVLDQRLGRRCEDSLKPWTRPEL